MTTQIRIELGNVREGGHTNLVTFFELFGNIEVQKIALSAKGDADIVIIALTVIGSWAAERYLLDPIADRVKEWTKALGSLKGKSFKLIVRFQSDKLIQFETIRISSPFILLPLWKIIKSASDLLASRPELIGIDRIMIIPHKKQKVLLVCYQGKRPSHYISISENTVIPIRSISAEGGNGQTVFWEIEQLAVRLEYLRKLTNQQVLIEKTEEEITHKISGWL